jgi:hypothetical protein
VIAAYVCANGTVLEYPSVESAIDGALVIAALVPHPRVGVGTDPSDARRAAARALPGMVVCPRCEPFREFDCCPLTASTALVRPRVSTAAGTPKCVRTAARS